MEYGANALGHHIGILRESISRDKIDLIRKLAASAFMLGLSVPCTLSGVFACYALGYVSITVASFILVGMTCNVVNIVRDNEMVTRLQQELDILIRVARENPSAHVRVIPPGTAGDEIFAYYNNEGKPIVATRVEPVGDAAFVPPPGYSTGLPKGGSRRTRRVNRRSRYRQVS